ncbi:MAG: hypothetical protein U1E76_05245 [Planctomycetota bacterium]
MTEVERQIAARRARLALATRREQYAIAVALGIFLSTSALAGLGLSRALALPVHTCALAGTVLLIGALAWRVAASRARKSAAYALDWRLRAKRRRDDDHAFGQDAGVAYGDPGHAFALDLDVFGAGSLYERLNDCHTVLGRDALAELLREPPSHTIDERQAAVRELVADMAWRESLEVELCHLRDLGSRDPLERRHLENDTRALLEWAPAPPTRSRRGVVNVLAALASIAAAGHVALDWPWAALAPFYLTNLTILLLRRDLNLLLTRFVRVRATLRAWSRVLCVLERAAPRARVLCELRAELFLGSTSASRAIARLSRLADRLAQRKNPLWFFSFDVLWLVDLRVRRDLLAWQAEHGPFLARWLRAAARLEALNSLAAYAEAAVAGTWPVVRADGPVFAARDLAHPLLPARTRVGNDLELLEPGTVLLVTGSNMSGKSTWLRAVGLAVVMARLGLPVTASHLAMRDADVVTAMRVQDSLQSGSSRFHAEVHRIGSVSITCAGDRSAWCCSTRSSPAQLA